MGSWYITILVLFILAVVVFFALISAVAAKRNALKGKRAVNEVYSASQYRNRQEKPHIPHNDFLARNLLLEEKKRKELEARGVTKYQPYVRRMEEERQTHDTEIVGIVEPKGFWTRFIISQKLGFIMARLNFQKRGGGRWVNFIAAQSMAQGKDQTRGR